MHDYTKQWSFCLQHLYGDCIFSCMHSASNYEGASGGGRTQPPRAIIVNTEIACRRLPCVSVNECVTIVAAARLQQADAPAWSMLQDSTHIGYSTHGPYIARCIITSSVSCSVVTLAPNYRLLSARARVKLFPVTTQT